MCWLLTHTWFQRKNIVAFAVPKLRKDRTYTYCIWRVWAHSAFAVSRTPTESNIRRSWCKETLTQLGPSTCSYWKDQQQHEACCQPLSQTCLLCLNMDLGRVFNTCHEPCVVLFFRQRHCRRCFEGLLCKGLAYKKTWGVLKQGCSIKHLSCSSSILKLARHGRKRSPLHKLFLISVPSWHLTTWWASGIVLRVVVISLSPPTMECSFVEKVNSNTTIVRQRGGMSVFFTSKDTVPYFFRMLVFEVSCKTSVCILSR